MSREQRYPKEVEANGEARREMLVETYRAFQVSNSMCRGAPLIRCLAAFEPCSCLLNMIFPGRKFVRLPVA